MITIKDCYIGHSRNYVMRENGHVDCINDDSNMQSKLIIQQNSTGTK